MMLKNHKHSILSGFVFIFLTVGAFFMANVPMPRWSYLLSSINVLLFALPAFWAVKMWLGWRDGAILLIILGTYTLLIETAAVITGFPYGHFGYSDHLGFKLFGLVPWTVAFAWTPLMLAAYSAARNLISSRVPRIIFAAFTLLLFDLVLDPGAVLLGFWSYPAGGFYYGVPVSNFVGWLFSGFIGSVIFEIVIYYLKPLLPTPVQLSISAFFIIFFWTALMAFGGLLVPAVIGAVIVIGLFLFDMRFHYSFDEMIVLVDDENNAIATAKKSEVHDSDTKLHRAFSIFLFNAKGELLLQQRSFNKKTWTGVWSNSCCGHTMLHEKTEKAAVRRLNYELGIRGVHMETALPYFRYRAEKDGVVENEICPVLIGFTDKLPILNSDEVAAVKWIKWTEFLESLKQPGCEISPWAIEEVELLAKSEIFRRSYRENTNV